VFEAGHFAYELKDYMESQKGGIFNSLPNSVADQLVATIGYWLARRKYAVGRQIYMLAATWGLLLWMGETVG
jgi:hypothetical protein